jgi:hypothetical protein
MMRSSRGQQLHAMKRSLVTVTPAVGSDVPAILGLTIVAWAPTVGELAGDCADEECRDLQNPTTAIEELVRFSGDADEHEELEELNRRLQEVEPEIAEAEGSRWKNLGRFLERGMIFEPRLLYGVRKVRR